MSTNLHYRLGKEWAVILELLTSEHGFTTGKYEFFTSNGIVSKVFIGEEEVERGKVRVIKPGTVTDLILRTDVSRIPTTDSRAHTFEMTDIQTNGIDKLTFQLKEVPRPASPEVRRYSRSDSLASSFLSGKEGSSTSIGLSGADGSERSTTLSD